MDFKNLLDKLCLSNFITLQLITTGTNPKKHSIEKITAIFYKNGKQYKKFIRNIDFNIVSNKSGNSIKEVILELTIFLKSHPIVMHNSDFCLDFINYHLENLNEPFVLGPDYDTLSLSKNILYKCDNFSLEETCKFYNIKENDNKVGLLFLELIKDICSFPLDLINEIVDISKVKKIKNQKLFFDLKQIILNNKKFNGIYESRIHKNMASLRYQNMGKNELNDLKPYQNLLSKDGMISKKWSVFENRKSQIDFFVDILYNLNNNSFFLAEAGTGLGKTIAYLLASIIYSKENDKSIIVSTYTKYLQDQIFYKDLPMLAEILDLNLKAIILKGRSNYICKTRLFSLLENFNLLLDDTESEALIQILIWNYFTLSGDISECNSFNIMQNQRLWNLLKSTAMHCSPRKCHRWGGCYRMAINDYINKVNIIIVNHSLLLSSIQNNSLDEESDIKYILDEGHNLISVTHDVLAMQINPSSLDNIIAFFDEKNYYTVKEINLIINKFSETASIFLDIQQKISILNRSFSEFFANYQGYKSFKTQESKFVINNGLKEFESLKTSYILNLLEALVKNIKKLFDIINNNDKNNKILNDLNILIEELNQTYEIFKRILNSNKNDICWAEFKNKKGMTKSSLHCAPRNISSFLKNNIFNEKHSGVLCSATLQFNNDFSYFKNELGLNQHGINIQSSIYPSPFLYNEQMRLFVYKTHLDINSEQYISNIVSQIIEYRKTIHNRVLVLCTSYNQIRQFKNKFKETECNSNIFYQSFGINRTQLVKDYLKFNDSILFGTSSFWEGIDLPGKDVQTLWIIKIPFANPKEPLFIAQSDKYKIDGKNSFMEYSLPEATIKFKQGFGRLIRNLNDFGICILSDPRLVNKKYGKVILDSLPVNPILYSSIDDVILKTNSFFKEFKA